MISVYIQQWGAEGDLLGDLLGLLGLLGIFFMLTLHVKFKIFFSNINLSSKHEFFDGKCGGHRRRPRRSPWSPPWSPRSLL